MGTLGSPPQLCPSVICGEPGANIPHEDNSREGVEVLGRVCQLVLQILTLFLTNHVIFHTDFQN